MKSLVFKINGATGLDAVCLRVLPESWCARRFARKLMASPDGWGGMLPGYTADTKFFMIMPNGKTWEVVNPQGDVVPAQRPQGVPINA